ncbi:hypothetical protein ABT224_10645 [Streptomyces sp. NPDC001584]|uniref:hypothetical protein n=1 Tax=Streptomyces sp. NPDC001584 TaxID=3154521 RepID=UPI0033316CF0
MSYRTSLRSLVVGACTAALLSGSGLLALPAQAQPHRTPATVTAARATHAELTVADFWQKYHDAVNGQHSEGKDSFAVRKEFLTNDLDEALTTWGSEHEMDPVFRADKLPKEGKFASAGENAGHEKVVMTQTFEDGTTQDVWYQVNLETMIIDGLQDPTT